MPFYIFVVTLCFNCVFSNIMLEFINRRNSDCYKWDSPQASENLPLWVADMDFKAAPAIINALQKRLNHGVFGYQYVPQKYYDSVANWFGRRHKWYDIKSDNLIYTTGVVPAISAILRSMTKPGDNVATFVPAYNCFFSSIRNLDCNLIGCNLRCVNNHFEFDWVEFEHKIQNVKVFILCNPHNPTGRVWTKDELSQIAQICEKHNVFVISDEIHCEFVFPGFVYTSYALVAKSDNYCVCTSASKAFNIAGLQCANIHVPNKRIYTLIEKGINIHEVCDINPFGMVALMAAYNESENWIDELNEHIVGQYTFLCNFINTNIPKLQVTRSEGTYLAWVNMKAYDMSAHDFCELFAEHEHVLFNSSEMYGADGYIRINLATSREILSEALTRLKRFTDNLDNGIVQLPIPF